LRAVVWFQGCTLNCPGCFNPASHDPQGGVESDTETLAAEILSQAETIKGISVSGGEPFQQPEALLALLERFAGTRLSKLAFSGYTLAEITNLPLGPAILRHVDVLIAGRYVPSQRTGRSLIESANQQIHLLTDRYTLADLAAVPPRELVLHRDGTVSVSGVAPWRPSGT
jgi:anaerobic ribonucleoside-triphosphate reductase activating protein